MDRIKGATKVIIDTNALISQFKFGVGIIRELDRLLGAYEIVVPSSVIDELRRVKDRHARAAMKFANKFRLLDTSEKGDASILSLALEHGAHVITNDRELKRILKQHGITVIYLRQKAYLALDAP